MIDTLNSLALASGIDLATRPRPVAMNTSGHYAATNGRRLINVGSTTRGVSSIALSDGPMLTARARKAEMDNPLAANGIRGFVSEVVGTGSRPHSKHSNPDTRRTLEQKFALWAKQSSATRRIGAHGKPISLQSFWVQQQLVCRNVVVAGEAFCRFRYRLAADLSPTGLRVPLQLELIEPEQLPFWKTDGETSGKNIVRAGIEFNEIRERVAYHFYREHPGDSAIWPNSYEITRIPASDVLHVIEFIRGNQIRGITPLAPVIVQLADVDDYDDGERLRQKLGAYMFGWRESSTPDDPQLSAVSNTAGTDTAPQGAAYIESQPGQLTVLDANAGEKFGFYAHPGTPQGYEVFLRKQEEIISTIFRVTYAMLTGDVSRANYSSSRVAYIALRRLWRQFQQATMDQQFNDQVWAAWLSAAALVGEIDAADYRKNPDEYLNVEWLAEPWDWVDPKADIESIQMKLASALTSREEEAARLGKDVEEVDAAIARDHDREKKLGIVPVYGNMRVSEQVPAGQDEANADTELTPGGAN